MRKGFTLIEMIIVIAIAGILVTAVFARGCGANTGKAEELARDWAGKMYPGYQIQHVECMGVDSDGDGYASCNVSLKAPDGKVVTPPVECSAGWSLGSNHNGCRAPKANGRY